MLKVSNKVYGRDKCLRIPFLEFCGGKKKKIKRKL